MKKSYQTITTDMDTSMDMDMDLEQEMSSDDNTSDDDLLTDTNKQNQSKIQSKLKKRIELQNLNSLLEYKPINNHSNIQFKTQQQSNINYKRLNLTFENIFIGIIGLILCSIGFYCFLTQTKDNYWYIHSGWHFFVYISTLPLLIARNHIFNS